jgi:hypothetical protein
LFFFFFLLLLIYYFFLSNPQKQPNQTKPKKTKQKEREKKTKTHIDTQKLTTKGGLKRRRFVEEGCRVQERKRVGSAKIPLAAAVATERGYIYIHIYIIIYPFSRDPSAKGIWVGRDDEAHTH